MPQRRLAALSFALLFPTAFAQTAQTVANDARDAATFYVARADFIVGRLGRECLALVGRPESPQELTAQWKQRNARFVMASARYMDRRLDEAAAAGGAERRDAIIRELRNAVQGSGDAAVRSLLGGRKEDGCMKAITMLDAGALDISSATPGYEQIEALVRWAEQ